jgi:hypothetical protein
MGRPVARGGQVRLKQLLYLRVGQVGLARAYLVVVGSDVGQGRARVRSVEVETDADARIARRVGVDVCQVAFVGGDEVADVVVVLARRRGRYLLVGDVVGLVGIVVRGVVVGGDVATVRVGLIRRYAEAVRGTRVGAAGVGGVPPGSHPPVGSDPPGSKRPPPPGSSIGSSSSKQPSSQSTGIAAPTLGQPGVLRAVVLSGVTYVYERREL